MTGPHKVFPPRWRHLRIPISSRRAARAGLALYAPCRPGGIWAQRLAWWIVGIGGPRALPGEVVAFEPPATWEDLEQAWASELGPFDEVAVIQRRQAARQGLSALLISSGIPLAFVRVEVGLDPEKATEVEALRLIAESRPETFQAPEVQATGKVADWGYIANSPLPVTLHRPATSPPLGDIISDIQRSLGPLTRPDGVPSSWLPMHGDLTPWNLRALGDGRFVLFDWERAGWGPPGADRTLYEASEMALGWRKLSSEPNREAAEFWLSDQAGTIENERLRRALAENIRRRDGKT